MRSLTLALPSFQRRDALERALRSVEAEVRRDAAIARDLEVLVVLDGSTDSSLEMLQKLSLGVPLRWYWQPNAGLAAARNALLEQVTTDLVWFLDDDMVVGEGTIRRHRQSHLAGSTGLLMGPCLFPEHLDVVRMNRSWADDVYRHLAAIGSVHDPNHVSFANTSGPVSVFDELGGFDARLHGWGGEDVELGIRALRAGIEIRYEADAIVWHHQARDVREMCETKIDQGRNQVRLAQFHPEDRDLVLPPLRRRHQRMLFGLMRRLRPRGGRLLAKMLASAAVIEQALPGQPTVLLRFAAESSRLTGIAEMDLDGCLVEHLLSH